MINKLNEISKIKQTPKSTDLLKELCKEVKTENGKGNYDTAITGLRANKK